MFSVCILDKLLPGDGGALQLHLMHYCEACTAPRMPEFILYAFHSAYRSLPWRDLHPDHVLMEAFFKVSPRSPCPSPLGSSPSPVAVRHSRRGCTVGRARVLGCVDGACGKQPSVEVISPREEVPGRHS